MSAYVSRQNVLDTLGAGLSDYQRILLESMDSAELLTTELINELIEDITPERETEDEAWPTAGRNTWMHTGRAKSERFAMKRLRDALIARSVVLAGTEGSSDGS
jgi:hypothetical protein